MEYLHSIVVEVGDLNSAVSEDDPFPIRVGLSLERIIGFL
jgi:hypothetical protein